MEETVGKKNNGGMDWDEVERRLRREAAEEEIQQAQERQRKLDKNFEREISDIFGGASLHDVQRAFDENPEVADRKTKEILDKMDRLQRKGKQREAAALGRKHRGRLSRAAKKAKKGCVVQGVALAGASALVAYVIVAGMAEVAVALIR
jgi:hypothetical protein